ncbi:hypothetical protein P3T35_007692 [Kitasatospora sp. GP30]|jgi:hypothetical protein|nr:hypothetical protein [Kitasatospora sp. GP30]
MAQSTSIMTTDTPFSAERHQHPDVAVPLPEQPPGLGAHLVPSPHKDPARRRPTPYAGILTATLTDLDTGQPMPGQPITFTTGSTPLCTSTTDANGIATCNALLAPPLIILNGGYTATYPESPNSQPATAHGALITP